MRNLRIPAIRPGRGWLRRAARVGLIPMAVLVGITVLVSGASAQTAKKKPAAARLPAGATEIANVTRAVGKYASPRGRRLGKVEPSWNGAPSVLPVIATEPGWLKVRLPGRPNGSTAWIRSARVRLTMTPYRIVINLATEHLTLYEYGDVVFSAAAGVGTRSDPTPIGRFFVAFLEAPPEPNPGYGPFIIVTSAHSTSIGDWEGSGDALIGIHGPLGDARVIGSHGARVSHGCIRLQLRAQARLRDVPAGSPVDVIR
jgi:lipoprotein-anchoring transpeptidase ErfK/SrfK